MDYATAYNKVLRYGKALSPIHNPEIGQMFHAAVRGAAGDPDHTASKALADKMQEAEDWRHHILANPDPNPLSLYKDTPHSVSHKLTNSYSQVGFHPEGVVIHTSMPNHNGVRQGVHKALLNKEQYNALRNDAATDNVDFPEHPY